MSNITNYTDRNFIPPTSNRILRYAVVGGDCVWGAGFTVAQTLKSAAFWLDGGQGGMTVAEVQEQLDDSRNSTHSNGLYLIAREDDKDGFDRWMQSNGTFEQRNGQWYE